MYSFKVRDSIYFYLNFYVIGIFGITGWLISIDKVFDSVEKILISSLFTFFSLICLISLQRQYKLLEASRIEFLELTSKEQMEKELYKRIGNHSYKYPLVVIIISNIIIYFFILSFIWLFNK